jgi:hypothetical protein
MLHGGNQDPVSFADHALDNEIESLPSRFWSKLRFPAGKARKIPRFFPQRKYNLRGFQAHFVPAAPGFAQKIFHDINNRPGTAAGLGKVVAALSK